MTDDTPFFIVGAGRSGTTLLRLMLTGHSRLHIPPETWFIRTLVREFPLTTVLTQAQRQRAVAIMVGHERWPDLRLDATALQRAADVLPRPRLADVIELVYGALRSAAGKPRLGDKTPHYFAIAAELATLYPRARFIHVQRDGRDVAMSWIDAGWPRYYEAGFEWPAAVAAMRRQQAIDTGRILVVRYEELIAQPELTLRAICAFLGETFEPAMLEWRDRTNEVAPRDQHLHARLAQPLSDASIGLWRRRLSRGELFAVEACLHRELRASDYGLAFASRLWRPIFWAARNVQRIAAPALRRAIPWLQRKNLLRTPIYY